MNKYILTPEQFAFMNSYHELVEYAMIEPGRGLLDVFIESEQYQRVFAHTGMCWDDIYDRYEDTPGYDRALNRQFRYVMGEYILTPEQFNFMQRYHELIEYALIESKKGHHALLDIFIESEQYQHVFAVTGMGWDDIYDRYQDTPGYDWSLRAALHKQLHEDVNAGLAEIWYAPRPVSDSSKNRAPADADNDTNAPTHMLRKLRDYNLQFDDDEQA